MSSREFFEKIVSNLEKIDSPQLQQVLRNLVRQRDFFEIILSNMDEGVAVTDPKLNVIYHNKQMPGILARGQKSYIGKSLLSAVSGKFFEFLTDDRFDLRKRQKAEFSFEEPESADITVNTYPIFSDDSGELLSALFIIRDVTDARREEQQRKQIERLSTLSKLTAGVAHDIKNPLNALDIHSQLLLTQIKAADGEAGRIDLSRLERSAGVIQEEIRRLGRIVHDYLDAVRPTRAERKPESINDLINVAMDALRPRFEEAGVQTKLELEPELPNIAVDGRQIQRALDNVLQNALEAIDADSDDGLVTVRTWYDEGEAHIEIADNGCGIPKSDLATIFEPYFTTKFNGTGLGLMNVYHIVEEHQGSISVDSEVGSGTAFTLSFPLRGRPVRLLEE